MRCNCRIFLTLAIGLKCVITLAEYGTPDLIWRPIPILSFGAVLSFIAFPLLHRIGNLLQVDAASVAAHHEPGTWKNRDDRLLGYTKPLGSAYLPEDYQLAETFSLTGIRKHFAHAERPDTLIGIIMRTPKRYRSR
ncbi:sodium-dependent bicarbonate transport family permease [Amphritea sp.]|uniref:sodium-dependent bicarbonate transport family permease n=1 Tax=Amphritea sp. TaxID=1872502 RepID=UPI0034543630